MSSKVFNLNNLTDQSFNEITDALRLGKVGVIPADTIYGIVGSALNQQTVEQIYTLRKRTPTKPMIILISSIEDLTKFNLTPSRWTYELLKKIWPNPVSVILPCPNPGFEYLHRGTNTLAFRMPKHDFLQKLLKQTGPLVAPSANFEGEKPALTILEAQKYFENKVDFYIDAGKLESQPSTVIEISDGNIQIIRQGAFDINTITID